MAETIVPSGFRRRRRTLLICLGIFLCGWLTWSLATYGFGVPTRFYMVPSNSMAPTIKPGDRIGVELRPGARPKRGEIWVFRMPPASKQVPNLAVKRVVGLPGEMVEVKGGGLWIDGRVVDEPYIETPATYTMPPLTLGPDEYFVLGDSRDSSHDSHAWGPLPADHLIGSATVRFWPVGRIGGFSSKGPGLKRAPTP